MKKTKGKRAAKSEAKDESLRGFFKPTDFSKKRIGFQNLHVSIAAEAIKHAERAGAAKREIVAHFKDLARVIETGKQCGGAKLSDSMVAASTYCTQIIVHNEAAMTNERLALVGLGEIGQLVDLKQVHDRFYVKVKRAVHAELTLRAKRRRR